MRPSSTRTILLAVLLGCAATAVAQAPPPPGGLGNPPPLKPKQPPPDEGDGERRDRPRAVAAPLPMMDGTDMPEIAAPTEEPVTSSGNVDLWRARIAARRGKPQASSEAGPAPR